LFEVMDEIFLEVADDAFAWAYDGCSENLLFFNEHTPIVGVGVTGLGGIDERWLKKGEQQYEGEADLEDEFSHFTVEARSLCARLVTECLMSGVCAFTKLIEKGGCEV